VSAKTFIDAQVFVALEDVDNPEEQAAAREFLRVEGLTGAPTTGANVLGEVFTALTRRRKNAGKSSLPPIMSFEEAVGPVQDVAAFPVHPLTREIVLRAVALRQKVDWGFFDLVNFATAESAGCTRFVSRDKAGGRRKLEGIELVDPFKGLG
jgi:predicted nucleic acid-binding protein